MGVHIYQNGTEKELKNAYIGEYKETLVYDFTQSDGGWTAGSGTYRNSNGFYRNGTATDGYFSAPQEIFKHIPKKITLTYNKTSANSGTGISTGSAPRYSMTFPWDTNSTLFDVNANGTATKTDLGSNPTGVINWVITIDSSTPNRTVTHKIGTLNEVTDTSGALKYIWDNKKLAIRIVNWTGNIYITGFKIEY